MGPLFGLFGSVSGVVFGQGLAPSSGIYPRELTTADLSVSSSPRSVPLLLTSEHYPRPPASDSCGPQPVRVESGAMAGRG